MGDSEEWARTLGEEVNAKRSTDREDAEAVALHRHIIAEKMPLLWEEVLAAFQVHCIAFNEQVKPERTLALHRMSSHDFMVRPDALPEIVRGTYEANTKRIRIQTSAGTVWFDPEVVLRGSENVALVSSATGRVTTAANIAQDTIRDWAITK